MTTGPRVSVVIPAYESEATIADCLRAIEAQTFQDFEVIVVNSSVGEERVRRIVERFPRVRLEQASSRLLPQAALNAGVRFATGDLLVFTAPDCFADRDWLTRLVDTRIAGHEVIAGSIDLEGSRRLHTGMHLAKFSWRLSSLQATRTDLVQTANACYSRGVWDAIGPFDGSHLSGDVLLSRRAAALGWSAWFEPTARVRHRHRGSSGSFLRERFERGDDGAVTRMTFQSWPRVRAAVYIAALPLLPLLLLARAGRDAVLAGWSRQFASTLPLQLAAQVAWCLGEARAHLRFIFGL